MVAFRENNYYPTGKKVAPRDELRGHFTCVRLVGIEPTTSDISQNCALSDELQPHAMCKLDSSVRSSASALFSMDIGDTF